MFLSMFAPSAKISAPAQSTVSKRRKIFARCEEIGE
jgi:hypothetical protein